MTTWKSRHPYEREPIESAAGQGNSLSDAIIPTTEWQSSNRHNLETQGDPASAVSKCLTGNGDVSDTVTPAPAADLHDHRDRGDPLVKRETGWRNWERRDDMDLNLRGRR